MPTTTSILTCELTDFLAGLYDVHQSLSGIAEFRTMEGQLLLQLSGNGLGHMELQGEVIDNAGVGNRLQFKRQFDQTELRESIRELRQVALAFPKGPV